MDNNFNVQDFLKTLEDSKPQAPNLQPRDHQLEKVYLNYPDNYGKYQIFPMNSTVTGFPFVPLHNTREVKIKRQLTKSDGTVTEYEAWVKILPNEAYVMGDQTGRVVSSLTGDEAQLLNTARTLWDQLYDEMGGNQKMKDGSKNPASEYLRRRHYTVFNAKCINKWSLSDARTPARQNFAALFVCTAKGFSQAIGDSIEDGKISHGGDTAWLQQIYNRELTGRSGYLIFSIALNQGGKIGYSVSATHESDRGAYLTNFGITPEEAELMTDPVEAFLGWQAGKEGAGRLFNRQLIADTIDFMSKELATVRMAKSNGIPMEEALKSEMAQVGAPVAPTSDPMLNAQAAPAATPFQQPQSAPQLDPVTGGSAAPGFSQPAFSSPGGGFGNNPFGA